MYVGGELQVIIVWQWWKLHGSYGDGNLVKTELRMHVTKKKDNGAAYQREHCTSKYSVKHSIRKTLSTVKSPVKISMDSRWLTHSKVMEF
jgi:hypothetical protein